MSTLSLNVGNFITLKLSPTNYPLWREQALATIMLRTPIKVPRGTVAFASVVLRFFITNYFGHVFNCATTNAVQAFFLSMLPLIH